MRRLAASTRTTQRPYPRTPVSARASGAPPYREWHDPAVPPLRSALAALLVSVALVAPAPAAYGATSGRPAARGAKIARLFGHVTRDTQWKLVSSVRLQAETWHPEGIVKLGDQWLVSSVQVIEPTVK